MISAQQNDDGLTNACDRLKQASALIGDLNSTAAALCTNNQYACTNTCNAMITKYQNLADNCGDDCDSYSTYQDAISSLQAAQATCSNLAPNANALSVASLASGNDQGLAAACQQQAATAPGTPGDSGFGSSAPISTASAQSSGLPTATAPTYAGAAAPTGQLSPTYQTSAAATAGINLGSTDGASGTYYGNGYGQVPVQVKPVPGDTNGFGITGPGANLNDGLRPSPGSPGFPTDIDQGLRSGGYSAPGGPGPTGVNAHQAAGLVRKLASEAFGGFEGLDLKQYLPGGARYNVSGATALRREINGKEDDIFRRISVKYVEKCKLGELYRCAD